MRRTIHRLLGGRGRAGAAARAIRTPHASAGRVCPARTNVYAGTLALAIVCFLSGGLPARADSGAADQPVGSAPTRRSIFKQALSDYEAAAALKSGRTEESRRL